MSENTELRIGIDVGGTNTDAVVIDGSGGVVSAVKVATTPEPIDGIRQSLDKVLGPVDKTLVAKAMLGTTHPANAIIQRKGLDKVAVLRLAAPSSLGVRPGAAWPNDIRDLVIGTAAIVEGGNEYTGAEIAPLDEDAIRRLAGDAVASGCTAIAVSAAFSPAVNDHELRALEVLRHELGAEFSVSLSHQIGSLGLLERENATILNAALLSVATGVVDGFEEALSARQLSIDSYLAQNDGTLMTAG
ncbi:MAG: hydantoinase/oxoprolinase family protein, partial [Actinomycetia bacterium]|nr:hydantoinase/oxoprolinase family protein [Actinomycetes bacterium]